MWMSEMWIWTDSSVSQLTDESSIKLMSWGRWIWPRDYWTFFQILAHTNTTNTTTTPQTVTAWNSYGSYCISIHWKEGIAPGNGARTVRPAAAVAAAAGPSLTPRIWRKFVWDDQTDAPRVVVVVRGNAIDMSKEASESWRSWSFDLLLLHKQQYTKFNSYSTSLMLIQSCGRSL